MALDIDAEYPPRQGGRARASHASHAMPRVVPRCHSGFTPKRDRCDHSIEPEIMVKSARAR
jgi:hypothetical protein